MSADMLSYVEFVGLSLCQDGTYVCLGGPEIGDGQVHAHEPAGGQVLRGS